MEYTKEELEKALLDITLDNLLLKTEIKELNQKCEQLRGWWRDEISERAKDQEAIFSRKPISDLEKLSKEITNSKKQ